MRVALRPPNVPAHLCRAVLFTARGREHGPERVSERSEQRDGPRAARQVQAVVGRQVSLLFKNCQIGPPRSNRLSVLLRQRHDDLTNVIEVMHHPGGDKLP